MKMAAVLDSAVAIAGIVSVLAQLGQAQTTIERGKGFVWSCNRDKCVSTTELMHVGDTARWELNVEDYPADCAAFDYELDGENPDGLYASGCAWISNCNNAECEGHCVANNYQLLNAGAVAAEGQLDAGDQVIERDTPLAWAMMCPLIAARVYRLKEFISDPSQGPVLEASSGLEGIAPGEACPTDADIDSVADQLNARAKKFHDHPLEFSTKADTSVYPLSYQAKSPDDRENFASFIGTADEAKKIIRDYCDSAIVSEKLAAYIITHGAYQYAYILQDQKYSIDGIGEQKGTPVPGTQFVGGKGVTVCRDNFGLLEGLFKYAVVKPGQGEKITEEVSDLEAGVCMDVSYAATLDTTFPWTYQGAPGSCRTEIESTLREMYVKCSAVKNKAECTKTRFPDLQKDITSYMLARDTEISTGKLTDECMVTHTNPWTHVSHHPTSTDNPVTTTGATTTGGTTHSGGKTVRDAVGDAYNSPEYGGPERTGKPVSEGTPATDTSDDYTDDYDDADDADYQSDVGTAIHEDKDNPKEGYDAVLDEVALEWTDDPLTQQRISTFQSSGGPGWVLSGVGSMIFWTAVFLL